jgi:hypothetical protein
MSSSSAARRSRNCSLFSRCGLLVFALAASARPLAQVRLLVVEFGQPAVVPIWQGAVNGVRGPRSGVAEDGYGAGVLGDHPALERRDVDDRPFVMQALVQEPGGAKRVSVEVAKRPSRVTHGTLVAFLSADVAELADPVPRARPAIRPVSRGDVAYPHPGSLGLVAGRMPTLMAAG